MLDGLPLVTKSLTDFAPMPSPAEDGNTFEANARLKAEYYARALGCWVIADDSGLEVDALGGDPGIYSARYAGEDATDFANNAKLIQKLTGIPAEQRTARFRCVAALAEPGGVLATAHGTIEGRIIDQPHGSNGFGYDPHFFVPEFSMTTAEMPPEQKNRISHRGRALAALRPQIEQLLRDQSQPP
jgi:XTP/dITP diphosphohydrolase